MMYSSNAESYRQFLIDRTKQYQSIVGASPTDGQVKQASAVDFIKNNKRIQMMEKADKVGKKILNEKGSLDRTYSHITSPGRAEDSSIFFARRATNDINSLRGVIDNEKANASYQSGMLYAKKSVANRAAMRNRIGDSNAFGSHSGPELQINKARINGKNPNFGHTSTISGEDFKPKTASFDILGNYN